MISKLDKIIEKSDEWIKAHGEPKDKKAKDANPLNGKASTGGGDSDDDDGDTDATSTTASPTSTTTDDPTTTTTATPTSTPTSDPSTGCTTACTDASEGSGFIYGAPDAGSALECDIQAEDCPTGQKCMPWVDGGGSMWNALKCVPVDPAPVAVGEACDAPGGGLTGIDNCDKHVMCFEVQGDTGVCRAMCNSGTCEPGTHCFTANDAILQLCLPACDLNMPACPPGHTCLPVPAGGVCAPGG